MVGPVTCTTYYDIESATMDRSRLLREIVVLEQVPTGPLVKEVSAENRGVISRNFEILATSGIGVQADIRHISIGLVPRRCP